MLIEECSENKMANIWKPVCLLLLVTVVNGIKEVKKIVARQVCSNGGFYCRAEASCIDKNWVCDTEWDCNDGSDEVGCPTDCSGHNQFKCLNGRCVTAIYRCDGDNDCGDHSDELNCHSTGVCPSGDHYCAGENKCLPQKWVCDAFKDCQDGSDEAMSCPTDCSHINMYKCRNGQCTSREFVCNGHNDCGDSSDEFDCEHFVCLQGEIKCDNFLCIEASKRCDGRNDCGTGYDERGCSG